MFANIGRRPIGFHDFRLNGLLLPANEASALRTRLPLHRGPHRHYNQVVIERVGRIEAVWSRRLSRDPGLARQEAILGLRLLQSALRRRLLSKHKRLLLNRHDPIGKGVDFTTLDAMAERVWNAT